MKKVILTGATGLIGKESLEPLREENFEVFALTRNGGDDQGNLHYLKCDIFNDNELKEVFKTVKPQYLLHFAWDTQKGYLESESNYKYRDMSLKMLEYFNENGGLRAVFAGTCFEYEFKDEPLKETDKLNPTTTYAKCKNELREKAEVFCNTNDIGFGWGRIFYVYGHNENPNRLTPYIINNLKEDKPVEIKCGQLIKDYMYTKDIAGAFVKFLDSDITGCVNICSEGGISLQDYATIIAKKLEKENFLTVKEEPTDQPIMIVGDNKRLVEEVRYNIKYSFDEGVNKILEGIR